MPGPLPLPADPSAARRARAFVVRELAECLDDEDLETCKLLVSELVTNSVVHAASEVQVECDRTPSGVTVRVRDADTGPLVSGSAGTDLAEGGRGLMLVERLAAAWGTEHTGGRKSVWFRLPRGLDPSPEEPVAPAASASGAHADPGSDRIALLTGRRRLRTLTLPEAMRQVLTLDQQLAELVERVVEALGATGGQVRTPSGDVLVSLGDVEGDGYTVPLLLEGRALGTFTAYLTDPDEDDLAFLGVAAERLSLLRYEHDVVGAYEAHANGLAYLTDAADLLAGTSSTRAALALLTQLAVPRLGDWAAAYAVTDHHRAHRVTAGHRIEERLDMLVDVLDRDADLDAAIRNATGTGTVTRLPLTLDVAGQRTFVVVLPLTWRSRTVGVLVLGRAHHLDAVGFAHLIEFGRRAAVAVDNARMHEEQSRAANALQAALLPPALPEVDGLEFAACYRSASPSLLVGGDFYDAFRLSDGSVVCAIGDVCGKGAEAAAVTGMSRDLIRLLLRDGHTLVATLQRLNRALIEDAASSRFCTVALARLAPAAGSGLQLSVCLAGHPEPVLLRADGTPELVGAHGDLLGVLPGDVDLTEVVTLLEPGDALVLYTDGITERRDVTRMFGQDGLCRALHRLSGGNAAKLAQGVQAAAQSFADTDLRDDLALLVARRTP